MPSETRGSRSVPFRSPDDHGFVRPTAGDFWRAGLPGLTSWFDRLLIRFFGSLLSRCLSGVRGFEHIDPGKGPFVLVANHNQRLEAPLLPTVLLFRRAGDPVRFVADWPMKIVPLFGRCFKIGRMITVTQKDARPRWLNVFRPLFHEPVPAFDRALLALQEGDSVGVFVEGTMNRHPTRLLRGRTGAARLAATAGVPVVPVGIRFPEHDGSRLISDRDRLSIDIGAPIEPPSPGGGDPEEEVVEAFHASIMGALERLSGKRWDPDAPTRRIPLERPQE
ncbi:MAG: lysophospholipid acyltransferase family protein [Acidobacteriota bacterium]